METAIRRAIEGGYDFEKQDTILSHWENDAGGGMVNDHFLIDPLFWQALGKALNHQELVLQRATVEWSGQIKPNNVNGPAEYDTYFEPISEPWWKWQMIRFTSHIAEGKPVDDFFNELLK